MMAPKRKHQDSEDQSAVHADRQVQVYGESKPVKRQRKSEPARKQMHASSVNAIKKKIRDVSRRLERSTYVPADVRVQDERALVTYEKELAEAEAEKIRQKMIKKYHMVRFFERKKATRILKKLRKRLVAAESTEEVEKMKTQMHVVEVDLNYAQYYPLNEVYVSLYPPKASNATDEDEDEKSDEAFLDATTKPAMWAEVETCMDNGTLNKLRNRAPATPANTSKRLERKPAKPKAEPAIDTTGMKRRERRSLRYGTKEARTKNKSLGFEKNQIFGASLRTRRNEADDDSDGGFFEE